MGLLPIGRHPQSKLWEFAEILTGKPPTPRRGPDGQITVTEETGLVLVLVPGGTFTMGGPDPAEKTRRREYPRHEVTLSPFFLSKYEVTQAQWQRIMGYNFSVSKGQNLPVETVSLANVESFCQKLELKLPTEAQWEYACRAGTTDAFGGTGSLDDMGWYESNSGRKIHPVGEKKPNDFGLHDTHGNVFEWCGDWYGSYELPVNPGDGERQMTKGGVPRVIRGGCFVNSAENVRSASRYYFTPELRSLNLGLRPARVITK